MLQSLQVNISDKLQKLRDNFASSFQYRLLNELVGKNAASKVSVAYLAKHRGGGGV